jgi:hypothetical protein
MSSFIVGDITIDRFMSVVWKNSSEEGLTKLGRNLLRMNVDATEQRYPTHPYLDEDEREQRIRNYKFHFQEVTPIQALKSMSCFLYQCSEGTIPKRALYKQMRKKETELAFSIVDAMPEYDKAEWG